MEFAALEAEAKAKAAKHVANMLHAPDKLEKIDQMKFNIERKKASVEAMLKTAMQSQLDGVRTGLTQLEKALNDISEVRQCLSEIEESMQEVPSLVEELSDVREETIKHSQLLTARENLKHIFMVPETVRQTEHLITDGKLLEAHKYLVDLENSRDDLLFELHRLPYQSSADKELLKTYFEPVSRLSDMMEKQIKFILRRTLNTVRKEPKGIVTALRIIEREEKYDQDCAQRLKSTGFIPPGRPKRWKDKGLSVLKTNVQERIEGNQLESREDDKMWLVRHLELIRMITLEDLRIAKTLCQPVFPPHYEILELFMELYHEALSLRLMEIVGSGLEGQEYVTVLSWIIQTYNGKDFMGSPSLNIPQEKVRPLLDQATIERMQKEYLENMHKNYIDWMRNTLSQEVEDWQKEDDPDLDNDGCFHTSAPIIVYQMIDENLQVAATISPELVNKVLVLSMGEVSNYGHMYRNAIIEYKTKYFKDRTAISRFTRYMIAIVNNCERFEELGQELKTRWWKPGYHDNEASSNFEQLLNTFQNLKEESSGYLLDESFLDLDVHFTDLLSSKWENTTDAIDTVCATLEDYFEDYRYLKPKSFEILITLAQERVAHRYITCMLQNNILRRKISFDTNEDRRKAANKIRNEAEQLKRLIRKVAGDMADFDSPFDALSLLAEVLKSDEEILLLDLGTLVKRYPDVTHEQLVCLLLLRGDTNRQEARDLVSEVENVGTGGTLHAKSIFSKVQVTSSLNPFANKDVPKNPFATD